MRQNFSADLQIKKIAKLHPEKGCEKASDEIGGFTTVQNKTDENNFNVYK
jgi:hypothetical protein